MKDTLSEMRNTSQYMKPSVEETLHLLQASTDGLTKVEVEHRLQIFGFNEVNEKRSNPVLAFLKRYWGPMPWLLELAIVLSIVLKHYLEARHNICAAHNKYRHWSDTVSRLTKSSRDFKKALSN